MCEGLPTVSGNGRSFGSSTGKGFQVEFNEDCKASLGDLIVSNSVRQGKKGMCSDVVFTRRESFVVREFRVHRNLADDTNLELKDGEAARTAPQLPGNGNGKSEFY